VGRSGVLFALTGLLAACEPSRAADPPAVQAAAPQAQERTAPAPAGLDHAAIVSEASGLPQLRSLLVSRDDTLLVEHYAPDVRPTAHANIKSASKGILTALVGVALARGLIPSLSTPVATYFPELRRAADPRKREITIEHLLTMQTGLESTSGRQYGAWVRSRDWVRAALARPMVSDPGTSMEYSTGTSHVLSGLLTKVTRTSTWAFARDVFAEPLGITLARWPRDPQGIYFGGNDMLLTPRQMVRVGRLYLRDGVWPEGPDGADVQVLPAGWVEASCTPRTRSRFDPDREFGYGWWIQDIGGQTACFAWGYGGQYIMVFRDLDLVVVATSSPYVSDERHGHRRALLDLIATRIVAPLSRGPRGAGQDVR
jgi:CubicO group peptidase (beta-lactamase class C family)